MSVKNFELNWIVIWHKYDLTFNITISILYFIAHMLSLIVPDNNKFVNL